MAYMEDFPDLTSQVMCV